MKSYIETYRRFPIHFNTDTEAFECAAKETANWRNDDAVKSSKSYSAIKKFIDEFIKDNSTFEPFKVRKSPSYNYSTNYPNEMKIVGIRKDNRFIYEKANGEKDQISEYDEEKYVLFNPEDDALYAKIAFLELRVDEARKKLEEAKGLVKGETLKQLKSKYKI